MIARRLIACLLLATSALAQTTPSVPLGVGRSYQATAPSTTPGQCVNGRSPTVFALDSGLEYECVDSGSSDFYRIISVNEFTGTMDDVDFSGPSAGALHKFARGDHRHKLDSTINATGADTWTGSHAWAPSSNNTPVRIYKTSYLSSAGLLYVYDTDDSVMLALNNLGLLGVNTEPDADAMVTIEGEAGSGLPVSSGLIAWFVASDFTSSPDWPNRVPGNDLTAGSFKFDNSGAGSIVPVRQPATPSGPVCTNSPQAVSMQYLDVVTMNATSTDFGYFQFDSIVNLAVSSGWTFGMIYKDFYNNVIRDAYWLGASTAEDRDSYLSMTNPGGADSNDLCDTTPTNDSTMNWYLGDGVGGVRLACASSYAHTYGNDEESVLLRVAAAGLHQFDMWVDGVHKTGTSGDPGQVDDDRNIYYFGRHESNANEFNANGKAVAEFFIYNRDLSDAEAATMNAYMQDRQNGTWVPATRDLVHWNNSSNATLSRIDENGRFGFGIADPAVPVDIVNATEQMRLGTSTSNYIGFLTPSGSQTTHYTLPPSSPVGLLHNDSFDAWSWSLIDVSTDTNVSVTPPITLTGDSIGIVNQGSTTTVLHGNAAGNATFGSVVSADITDATITADDLGANSVDASELVSTAVTPGTYGSAANSPQITIDADGRITAAVDVPITGSGGYTDENAQDAVGTILTDSSTIDFTYNDGAPSITAIVPTDGITSTEIAAGAVGTSEIADGTVALADQANVATGTVFYRKTAGAGSPEVQTLATLKTDLLLTGTNSGDQNLFSTVAVSGQSDVVADSAGDTLTLVAGSNVTLTTSAGGDSVTIAASAPGTGTVTSIATTAPITGGTITTTGTIGCATCVTSSASLTSNQIMLGAGSQASAALGSLGTTTTVLHGNAAGAPTYGAVALASDVSGTLPVGNGGTGVSSLTSNGVLYGGATVGVTAAGTASQVLIGGTPPSFSSLSGAGIVPASRTITAGAGLTGGGDLSADRTFDVGAGTGITVNANDVALTIPVAISSGGTGQTTATAAFNALDPLTTLGDTLYHNGTDSVRLAGSTTATLKVLTQTGTGAASAAPVWNLPSAAGIVSGSGTTNRIPIWTSSSALGDSLVSQGGVGTTRVRIDASSAPGKFLYVDTQFLTDDRLVSFQDRAGTVVLFSDLASYQPLDANLTTWAAFTRASGFDTFAETPTSANLDALVTDDTGSGALVFANTPTLVTPALGAATATSINGVVLSGTSTPTLAVTGTTTVSGANTGDQTSVSGNAGTVTISDAGGDTTTSVLLGPNATGNQVPRSDGGITYDATNNALTVGGSVTSTYFHGISDSAMLADSATFAQQLIFTPTPCSAGSAGTGVDVQGNAQSCTAYQPYDATELSPIAGLTSAADKFPYYTGAGTAALAACDSVCRAFLDDTTVAAQRADLAVGYALPFQSTAPASFAASTTYFHGMVAKSLAASTTAARNKIYIRRAGVIRVAEVYTYTTTTAGSNEAWTMSVRLNDTTDYAIATVSAATNERTWTNTSINITVAAGDFIEIKNVTPAWGTAPVSTNLAGYVLVE